MIKKLFIYMALILGLAACSDEIFDGPRDTIPENGEIPISFVVPEMYSPTRAADASGFLPDAIGAKVTMLVYDGPGSEGKLIDKKDFTNPTGTIKYTVPKDQRKNPNLFFLFFTNDSKNPNRSEASFAKNNKITDDLKQTSESVISSDGMHLVMSGAASITDLLQMNPILLHRNAARISVVNHEDNTDKLDFPFEVYGPRTGGLLFGGGYGKHASITLGTSKTLDDGFSLEDATIGDTQNLDKYVYVQPTYNKDGNNQKKSYVVIKAKYNDKWYYYCLNFINHEDGILDILPNHYYEFQIKTKNMRAGYDTPEEARKNPVALSSDMYLVVDYSPKVMNLVSDGMRTLGVNHILSRNDSGTGYEYLYIKLASNGTEAQKKADYEDFEANYADYIKCAHSWITLTDPATNTLSTLETASAAEAGSHGSLVYGTEGYKTDGDQIGKLYKVKVYFTGKITGVLDSKISISWKGLNREVPVEWHRVFDSADLYYSVTTKMNGGGYSNVTLGTSSSTDYFKTLAGVKNDQGEYTTLPQVWGATADDNGGESRDQGLHFPMPYGNINPKNATYTHTVTLQDLGETNAYSWTYDIDGDPAIKGHVKVTNSNSGSQLTAGTKPTFTITNYNNNYDYGVGTMTIYVKQGEGDNATETPFYIPLYHTGFFHKDYTGDLAKGLEEGETHRDWTYYEVVNMEGFYWLDRNLGAHSSNMYLQSSTGMTYAGDPAAAGGYYRAAKYNKGGQPIMRDGNNSTTAICPPGYDFPTKDEFDKIRKATKFSTATVGSYNDASYEVCTYNDYGKNRDADDAEAKVKTVYFPKARYYKHTTPNGESRSGYYWTSTASSGVEKDEVGAWLNCFMLSGANTSFMNGEVDRSDSNHGYGMAIRCVAKDGRPDVPSMNVTSFFVTGATHVFLYTLDTNGKKVGTTTWPGHAICTYNTASNTYNFTYESRTIGSDQLYAIFNYKDSKGKIHTISRAVPLADEKVQTVHGSASSTDDNSNDFKFKYTDDKGMDQLVGFKVVGGIAPDYDNYGSLTQKTFVNDRSADKFAYWNFTLAFDDAGKFVAANSKGGLGLTGQGGSGGGGGGSDTDTHVLICWPQGWTKGNSNWLDRFYMWNGDNKPFGEWDATEGNGKKYNLDGNGYYWVWVEKSKFTSELSNNGTYNFKLHSYGSYNNNGNNVGETKDSKFDSNNVDVINGIDGLDSSLKSALNSAGVKVTKYYKIKGASWD